jgi:hypothetical protein
MAWLSEQPGRRTVTSEEELARKVAHARRLEVAAKARMPDAPPNDRSDIAAVVERVLGRMAPDTSAQQAATLIEAADKALSSGNAAVARTWLGELRAREQVVDAAVRERRAGIEAAVRYLAALRLEDVSPDLFPSGAMEGFAPVVNRLEAVAAGDRPLTAELRREAEDAVLQAQDLADQCMNTETLAAACAALGYRVRRGSDRALMEITRDEWGEDRVRFNLSEGQLTATFGAADADTPATVIDAGRLRRWKDDFELLRANADENGLSLNLISTVEPDELSSDVEGADVDDADADMEPEKRRRTAAAREKERPR